MARRSRRRRAAPSPPDPAPGFLAPQLFLRQADAAVPRPRPLPRQAHAAMLADLMQLWAGRGPVNYTAPGAYGVLNQYLGSICAMVGSQRRV